MYEGCRFVPYTSSETKPQMVPTTYRSKYWFPGFGFDSFAKATALCSCRISFCLCCTKRAMVMFSPHRLAKPRFVALLRVSSARVARFPSGKQGQHLIGHPLIFGKGKHMKYMIKYHQLSFYKNYMETNNLSKTQWFLPTTLSPPNFWEGLTACVLWSSMSVNTSTEK